MEYIKRFRDIALDCYDHCEERTLVGNVHDKHDQGVRGYPGKIRDLPDCTIVTKGQKDCLIYKTECGQKKCSASYDSIYW